MSDSGAAKRYTGTLSHNLDPDVPFESDKYPSDSPFLLKCIAGRRWEEVKERLKSGPHYIYPLPGSEDLPRIKETGFASTLDLGFAPLHFLMNGIKDIPLDVFHLLLNESREVLVWPDLSVEGFTPLHHACMRAETTGNAGEKLIFVGLLLEMCPEAAWVLSAPNPPSLDGLGIDISDDCWSVETPPGPTYPLHALLQSGNVTVSLCEKFCLLHPPRADLLPQIELKDRDHEHYPVMRAIDYYAPDDVIIYLLKQSQRLSAREHTCVPMQSAAFNGCTMPVLRELLEQPGMIAAGIEVTNGKFSNPLHYLLHSETIERWPYEQNTEEHRQDLVSPQDMMRVFIQQFAVNADNLCNPDQKTFERKKARLLEDHPNQKRFWLTQAQKLINDKENGQTVLDKANELQAKIMKKNNNRRSTVLQTVINELQEIKDGTFTKKDFDNRQDWVRAWRKFALGTGNAFN